MVQLFCDIQNGIDDAKNWVSEHKKVVLGGLVLVAGGVLMRKMYWHGFKVGCASSLSKFTDVAAKVAPDSVVPITNEIARQCHEVATRKK